LDGNRASGAFVAAVMVLVDLTPYTTDRRFMAS